MADQTAGSSQPRPINRKKRILFVVDGDAANLYYMGMLLQRLDYSIFTTKMAEETLEIMKFSAPALVLTEISLPKMSGIQFLRQIKRNQKTKSVPVIVYSASADSTLKDICKREGCADAE